LSEAAVAEEVVAQPESTPSTPPSEAVVESPSIQEAPPASTGEETPAGEGEGLEPAAKPLEQWTLQELNEKGYREGLSSEETKRRDSLQQSYQQRQDWERQQLAEADQRQRSYVAAMTKTYDEKRDHVLSQLDAFASGQDGELTKERVTRAIEELKGEAQRIAEAPIHYDLDRLALSPAFFGDSVQNRRSLAAQSVNEKIDAIVRRSYELGRNAGPTPDHVVLTQKELDAREKAASKKALDEFKSANPGYAPPAGGGRSAGGRHYSDMTTEERMALSPSARDAAVAAEAAARAGR
jgi:hypothetical protein